MEGEAAAGDMVMRAVPRHTEALVLLMIGVCWFKLNETHVYKQHQARQGSRGGKDRGEQLETNGQKARQT